MAGAEASTERGAGKPVHVLFVCLGNICRSPTAEGVMRNLIEAEGMQHEVTVDSAGTGAWHAGSEPDERASAAARAQGVTLTGEARQIVAEDFERFDLIVAMDGANLRDLRALAGSSQHSEKLRLMREFDPDSGDREDLDVPDPYYGGEDGFDRVFALVAAACRGLLAEIRANRVR